jgi:signal transduction histidine kinase
MQEHAEHATGSAFLPHGFCYLWNPELLWTHVIADLLIGVSYVTISVALAWLVHSIRRDIPFSWVFVAFGLFIITCGMTHFMEIWTMWEPVYWLSGGVKVVTAAASVATAITMPFTVPRAVATVRDARRSRERELAEARAAVLQEQNALLREEKAAADEARRAAEAADQAKTAFLRTMSHELRTPLNAILGYSELLETGVSGPVTRPQAEQLRRISSSGAHLLGLIDEVLTLARGDAAPDVVRIAPVDVPALVQEVVEMVVPQAMARGLRLQIEPPPAVTIMTDAGKLRQTLINLLTNAVKFTGQGTVALDVEDRGEEILFRVADDGPGIAPEHLEQIFEPFWQVDQGTTREHGGSGLGLSVSRHLVQQLGGSIEVSSEVGRGSVFEVRLPKRGGAAAADVADTSDE